VNASQDLTRNQLQALGTALVCDVLDSLHVRKSFLGPEIRSTWACPPVAGIAYTISCEPAGRTEHGPYGVLFEALGEQRDNTILVISAGDQISGVWGELLSVAARARGVSAVVMNGLTRDVTGISALKFPVFATGTSPLDSAGRQDFTATQIPLSIGGVAVNPGDWVVADDLGVAIIPAEFVDKVIELGIEKMRGESTVKSELESGSDLGEVFRRHGIL